MQTTIIQQALVKQGIDPEADLRAGTHLVQLFQQAVEQFGPSPAVTSLGHTLSYQQLGELAQRFAAYLQLHTDLQPGDRIAIQLPNLIQYPVVLYGALMAGLVVVNTNPLYSGRELEHQLNDSGAKAIVVLANVANTLQQVVANTRINYVVVTELADLHPWLQRYGINLGAKYLKGMVPSLSLPNSMKLRTALNMADASRYQPMPINSEQVAMLQYTGGTTGVAKGAMLSHRNLVSNVFQSMAMFSSYGFESQQETMVAPLPLYHIYSFTTGMLMLVSGNHSVLIPDPRNTKALIEAMRRYPMTTFCGINTLFVSLCNNPAMQSVDFSRLKMTLSGGMALTADAAQQWQRVTGIEVYQGYGLTETSPVVTVNPGKGNQIDSIGLAVPHTQIKLVDDSGNEVAQGERGELCVKGPQVMEGYWQRPEATAEVMDSDGFFATGDIAILKADGYLKIVDRKKDMIVVSGFNVYPNELEDVMSEHPQVVECAAVGVADEKSGEAVKMFVVVSEPVAVEDLQQFCKERMTGYKVPRHFEFRDELPKSAVGKILRRELR
ncbi:AMP-binding protein [Oceanicoccus sp. KOV_DT_Chl]|uniref:AMP-binding protein n=1 Tax=Oceanicoccus sp. KOV_DT_Chl TaxID=1904639 RepID=UPI000C7D2B21|nr:AMP-binding protein [Oceanicoccus sp. KOV_DT_Chl]